ncbi:MAG TPA: hypothetical protein VG799_02265 [Gemmatimonadota bacterium]|nr:hypothetical protein [Gemmatimonadota bacterium]
MSALGARRLFLILLAAAAPAACGNAGGPSDIDDDPPPAAPDLSRIAVVPPSADGVARVVGEEDAVEASLEVRIVNPDATARNGGTTVEARTTAGADGSFSVDIPAQLGDDLLITAIDGGSESQAVRASSGPEPDVFTGQDLADVEMFHFANETGAVTLPFETGEERFIVVAQSLNPSEGPFDIRVTGDHGTRITERMLGLAFGDARPPHPEAGIREAERRLFQLRGAAGRARPRALAAAQDVGDSRQFFVVNRSLEIDFDNPDHFDEVTATLRFLGEHTELWVDDRTPAANVPQALMDAVGQVFDDETYPTDRAAFGEESDIDGNGRVQILLTPTVNGLNTQASVDAGVVILGFFFGADLFGVEDAPFSNEGEIFFAIVPDPTKQFSPADFKLEGIENALSPIFAHEFEHMISANQHFIVRNGPFEETWLDEGLAHQAETLNAFPLQNRLRSALFLDEPEVTPLVAGDDTLERRGAAWLFVQYLVDRFGEEILGALVQTRLVGTVNIERATDGSMPQLFHEWTSALFLDGISDDPLFSFASLDLRTEFELARQELEEDLGEFLGIVERTLGPPAPGVTLRRQVSGLAAGYFEISATGPGARTILLDPGGSANLQTAVFRIE